MMAMTRDTKNKSLDKISGQLVFLNVALIALEREQGDRSLINQMHRSIQTVRATCEQAGYSELELLASDFEDFLRLVRDGVIELSREQLGLFRDCEEALECGVDSLRIGVPLSGEIEEVCLKVRRTLVESSLSASRC